MGSIHGFLEASDVGSIHRCQTGNVAFLEASDVGSIHRCQPANVGFLDASAVGSIHRCQPGNVRFLEGSDGASITITRVSMPKPPVPGASDTNSMHYRCFLRILSD